MSPAPYRITFGHGVCGRCYPGGTLLTPLGPLRVETAGNWLPFFLPPRADTMRNQPSATRKRGSLGQRISQRLSLGLASIENDGKKFLVKPPSPQQFFMGA